MTELIVAECISDALTALAERVSGSGEKNIIFCEDRLTLLAERAVLSRAKGTFFTEVTTFARFLSGERRVLSKQGSVMKLAALIEEHVNSLKCFRKGAAQTVYETIAQLSASRVDAEALRSGAQETDGMLRLKLEDLAFLLEKYTAFLHENELLDESGYLGLLPEAIERGVRGANVYFFAFPSFTRQAAEGVRAAFSTAKNVTGIFLGGDAAFCRHEGARVFREIAAEFGGAFERMQASTVTGDARRLYEGLFSPEKFVSPPVPTNSVFAFEAIDDAEEMNTVCALIKKRVAEGVRYRDIAVLVPEKARFLSAEKAFAAYRIPFFSDRTRPFSEHPFCAFALAVLGAVADGALPNSADAVAASFYFGEGGDEYRNYLLKFGGYRGAVRREIKGGEAVKGYRRESLVACREKMLSCLGFFPRKGKGAAFAEGVRQLLTFVNGEKLTEALAERFFGAEREFLSLAPLEVVLAEMTAVAGEESLTAREFAALLESGLSALEIAMIPQSADAVFLGDATESKFERVNTLFVTGLTDALPRVSRDTALISDKDIGKLSELSVEIEPALAVVNARARESLALNVCAFFGQLYLSRPQRVGDEETNRSEVLDYAKRIFRLAPLPELFPYDCSEEEPAALALLKYRERFEKGEETGEKFASLYAALAACGAKERMDALLSGGEKRPVAAAKELYFTGDVSPTLLENYFSCPYAGFAARGLRLREREERTVLDTDTGTFVHAVLERVAGELNTFQSEEECRSAAQEAARELLQTPRFSALADTKAGAYTGERLVSESGEVSAAAYRQLSLSAFHVKETEGEISLPALSLRGRADRVDEAEEYVRVIDYKTGAIDDRPASYYTGRKLQLQLYLLAASKGGRAAGAFYFPAAESFTPPDEVKYRLKGFFSKEAEVLALMDKTREEGQKSALFEGGGRTEKGMAQADFEDFLDYARLVSENAESEMRGGNIAPSPYEDACAYCKLKGMCGFVGTPRKESGVSCSEIVKITRRARGEE